MSSNARKSRDRIVNLRTRPENSMAAWDDTVIDTNAVFVPDVGPAFLDRLERCREIGLRVLSHQYLDGGVLMRFRCKRDADRFRQTLSD
jgi:hypothetical protein